MWKIIKNAILEIFFPTECVFCKRPGKFLCDDCKTLLEIIPVHHPERAAKYLDDIYAACEYENRFAQKMIMRLKYEPFHRSLSLPLADAINDHFRLAEENIDRSAVIIAVPLAQKRLRWRGFNQAQAIAEELGKTWQLPVGKKVLTRSRETQVQAELNRQERECNIKGAFACPHDSFIKNKTVYLVDDVFTTGVTMGECAKVLKHHGATEVIGIAVARAGEQSNNPL
jgi:competence protein ComFC